MKSPCMDCTKRTAGCHARCFDYALYRADLKLEKQKISDYWHKSGYDPAIGDRNRYLRKMLRRKGK